MPCQFPPLLSQNSQNIISTNYINLHLFIVGPGTPDIEAVLLGYDSVSESPKP